jgi:branched-chain amino acid transport system substrate-binding protein
MERRKMRKHAGLNLLVALFISFNLMVTFLASKALAANEVVVAGILPLTGTVASWGIRNDRGMRYVFDMINAQGGVKSLGGAKIKYMVSDTESKPEVAQSQAEKVVSGDVSCAFGCNQSPATLVVSQVTERKKVALICVSDYDPLITERGFQYMFRTTPIMKDLAKTVLVFAQAMNKGSGTNFKKVGVLCEDSIVGDSAAKALEQYTKEIGYTLVDVVKYNASTTKDLTGVLSRYKAQGVELVVGHNKPADAIQIVRSCKEVGYNPAMIGGVSGGWVAAEFLKNLGSLAEGVSIASTETPDVKIGRFAELKKGYETKYNEEMPSTFVGGTSGAWLLYRTLEKCASKDPKVIAKALRTMDVKYGDGYYFQQFGCKFDDKGDNLNASATVFQVQGGVKNNVFPAEYATQKPVWPKPQFK